MSFLPLIAKIFLFHPSSDPNPPTELKVEQYTNSSIRLKWERPLNMDVGEYCFTVSYGNDLSLSQSMTNDDNIAVNNLLSGTQYSFTVKTVGALGYESTAVTTSESQYRFSMLSLSLSLTLSLSLFCSFCYAHRGQRRPFSSVCHSYLLYVPNCALIFDADSSGLLSQLIVHS